MAARGLEYTPVVSGTAFNAAALTNLPLTPVLATINGAAGVHTANGTITQTQTSPRDYAFDYTLADTDDFTVSQISWGFFNDQNVFQGTPADLGATVTLAMNGPAARQMKVEVIDQTNKKAVFLLNLTGAKQNYTVTLSGDNIPAGFDITRIAMIHLVQTRSLMGSSGTVTVETKGLNYLPVLSGTTYNAASLSALPLTPVLATINGASAGNTANGTITQTQTSPRDYAFDYTLADTDDFTVSQISWGFFNDQNVFQGTPADLGATVTLAMNGPAARQMKVEVIDQTNKKAVFLLNLTGAKQNYTVTLSGDNIPAGFDITRIAMIHLVQTRSLMGSSGTVTVETRGLAFLPNITPDPTKTAADISQLAGIRDLISFDSNAPQNPDGTVSLNPISPSRFNLNYDLTQAGSFGGSISAFDNFGTVAKETVNLAGQTVILGLRFAETGATGGIFLQLEDNTGRRARVLLTGIDTTERFYTVNANLLTDLVDLTNITALVLLIESARVADKVSTLEVRFGNHPFIPLASVTANPVSDFTTQGPSAGELEPCGQNQNPCLVGSGTLNTVTGFNQDSPNHFTLQYNLSNGASGPGDFRRFAGALIDFGSDFTRHFNASSGIVLGLASPSTAKVRIEVIDRNGQKAIIRVEGLTAAIQRFEMTQAMLQSQGLDAVRIRTIVIVVDEQVTGSATAQGTIEVETRGLAFVPALEITANPVSNFSNQRPAASELEPCANLNQSPCGGTLNTITSFMQDTADHFSLAFNLGNGSDTQSSGLVNDFRRFGGATIHFGTVAANQYDATNGIVLGLRATGTSKLKIEVLDDQNRKAVLRAEGVTNVFQNYLITRSALDYYGLNAARIQSIVIVIDDQHAGSRTATGTVEVNTQGLKFMAAIPPDPTRTAADVSMLAGIRQLSSFNSTAPNPAGTASLAQISNTRFNLTYDLTVDNSFVGSVTGFDDPGSTAVNESINLTGQTLVLGLRLAAVGATGEVILQLSDVNGRRAQVRLTGVNGTEKFYSVPAGVFTPEIDVTKVSSIVLLLEEDRVSVKSSALEVHLGNHPVPQVIPILNGTAYDSSAVASHSNNPFIDGFAGNTDSTAPLGVVRVAKMSADEFDMEYDLTPHASSFVFAEIAGGFFKANGDYEGTPDSLPENFVIAVRGHDGAKVQVEVVDVNRKKAIFILNLRPVYQNYTLTLSGANIPTGFDRTRIAQVLFVMNQTLAGSSIHDILKVQTKNLRILPSIFPTPLQEVKDSLLQKGLSYFRVGNGLDAATHFPYDSLEASGLPHASARFTQPTLVGFYLQILGDVVKGRINNGMSVDQALDEINLVMTNLLSAQTNFGWNGLLPFLSLDPLGRQNSQVGLGDNANLTQSLAVMVGSLEGVNLNTSQQAKRSAVAAKVDQFLNNQAPGYAAFVDPVRGTFRTSYDITTASFAGSANVDRLATEFRGAVAFLKVRYPSLPSSVWDGQVRVYRDYADRNGTNIRNLAFFDGGAFQAFWPLLRNRERDFIGFRNALYNHYLTQTDYAAQNRIPGFISASNVTDTLYVGKTGIQQVAETSDNLILDIGSTYGLAAAYAINPGIVLTWLNAIEDQLTAVNGVAGFFDAARSNSEVARRFLGIDIASTILGLSGTGADGFDLYLRNRGLELSYNLLYDQMSQSLTVPRSNAVLASAPPEFPSRSLAVFSNLAFEGTVNGFPTFATGVAGARFQYGILAGGFGGHFWNLNQNYNARANQLVIYYSIQDSPQQIKIELKNSSDQLLYSATANLVTSSTVQRLVINLPDQAALSSVQKVIAVVDQNVTGDTSGDFKIRAIDFFQFATSPLPQSAGITVHPVPQPNPPPPVQQAAARSVLAGSSLITPLNYSLSPTSRIASQTKKQKKSSSLANLLPVIS